MSYSQWRIYPYNHGEANVRDSLGAQPAAALLKAIASPVRLAILLAIGEGEACVCHLEAALGRRQAAISQHLMALRQAEVLLDRRDGRYVYYRLADPDLLGLVRHAGQLAGKGLSSPPAASQCPCPICASDEHSPSPGGRTDPREEPLRIEGG
jgi:DNA-binding transcriptional ArsR family regulator